MTTPFPVLVVDDEAPARRRLLRMIEAHPDLAVVGEAGDGATALERVTALRPAVVFLDVEMPALDGIAAAGALVGPGAPAVVFVTAHERFAAAAFGLDAVDYLLKPFDTARFDVAVSRIRRRLSLSTEAPAPRDRLVALARGETRLLRVEHVERIQAAGNYAEVFLADGSRHLVRETIAALAASLPEPFLQVSRSAIVRLDHVTAAAGAGHGDAALTLACGAVVRLSRRYRAAVAGHLPGLASRPSRGRSPSSP